MDPCTCCWKGETSRTVFPVVRDARSLFRFEPISERTDDVNHTLPKKTLSYCYAQHIATCGTRTHEHFGALLVVQESQE